MRGNLLKRSQVTFKDGKKRICMKKVIEQNQGHDDFVFHDGPPYAKWKYAYWTYVKQNY